MKKVFKERLYQMFLFNNVKWWNRFLNDTWNSKKKFNKDFKSFSIIDNDARYDEIENINLTKKFLNNKNIKLKLNGKSKLNFAKLKKLSKYHFKPVLTISSFLSSLLTKKISNSNIKVNLSGIGADEIFTGYYDHTLFYLNVIKKEKIF